MTCHCACPAWLDLLLLDVLLPALLFPILPFLCWLSCSWDCARFRQEYDCLLLEATTGQHCATSSGQQWIQHREQREQQ